MIMAAAPTRTKMNGQMLWPLVGAGVGELPAAVAVAVSPAFRLTIWPASVLTPTASAALRTETLPAARSPLIDLLSNETENVVFGASSILPALPRLMIAPAPSGVEIVLDEKIVRPLFAGSPFTVTAAAVVFPVITISPAALPSLAKATIEYVARIATVKDIVIALWIHTLLFIVLPCNRSYFQIISKIQTFQSFTRIAK